MTETLLEHNRAKSSLMGLDELDHSQPKKNSHVADFVKTTAH